ncbi:MAG TPA: ATP-binding cassette domain-containing protein [Gemmatimonadales bacterium]|nr:ATP-binding cassette domain-containing protein [Gemmatimonadales bacterium]
MTDIAAATDALPTALAPSAIVTNELTRRYGDRLAVDKLTLTIPAGTIFGLLGPNGAGKSTTIKMLTTLLPPTSGTAHVAGFDVTNEQAQVRHAMGYVPQLLSADGALTGNENLLLSARLYDIPRHERTVRISEALTFMGLGDVAGSLVKTYSGGMVRRLELAQAMLHRPVILFLDEPTIGLDPIARRAVWDRLEDARRLYRMTILITTHDMEEAEALCDDLAIMHAGLVAARGAPAELRRQVGEGATLDDVFTHFAGGAISAEGHFRDIRRTRGTASRLG